MHLWVHICVCVSVCIITSGSPYSSYEDRGDSHDQATEGSKE